MARARFPATSAHIERALDRPDTQAIFWGPVLMQILGNPGGGNFRELTLYRHLKRDGDYARAAITHESTTAAGDPYFTTHGFTLRPYYISDTQPLLSYFRRVEPTIVFGSIDTGVPNRKRDDGLPGNCGGLRSCPDWSAAARPAGRGG